MPREYLVTSDDLSKYVDNNDYQITLEAFIFIMTTLELDVGNFIDAFGSPGSR